MADHVADDETGSKAEDGPAPHVTRAHVTGAEAAAELAPHPSVVAPSGATGPASEWTASDARGPLSEAVEPTHAHPADDHEPVAAEPGHVETDHTETDHTETDHAETEHAVEPEPVSAVAPAPVIMKKTSSWPIAAGIVVGAIIGAGSALLYTATQSGSSDADQKIAALSARVDTLQNKPDPQPAIAALKTSVAALEGKVGGVQKAIGVAAQGEPKTASASGAAPASATNTMIAKTTDGAKQDGTKADGAKAGSAPTISTATADPTATKPGVDPAPLGQKIQALQASVEALQRQDAAEKGVSDKLATLAAAVAALKSEDSASKIADLQKQASTTQAGIASLGAEQKSLAAKVTNSPALAVVADSLVSRIDQGGPYASQVDALATIGADPAKIAVLKENADKGVPSAKTLAAAFEPLVDPIIASERHTAAPNASFMDKLKSGMFSLVSVRAVGDTTGDGLAAHVAAIQADLAHDDVAAAYAVWNALPPTAKAKSDAWGAQAKMHAEAMGAARALQAEAIAALGAKKS